MEINVVTIDFWNTLFNTSSDIIRNDARLKVLLSTLKDLGINIDNNKIDDILTQSWEYYNQIWLGECRTPSNIEVINYIWNKIGLPDTQMQAKEYVADFFNKSILYFPPELEPNALNAIIKLSNKYKLAIVSDTGFSNGQVVNEMMNNMGILKYFSAFSYSDETGVAKPNSIAYNKILNELDCLPINAIHIGDIERTDIQGAKAVGMFAIRYDGSIDSLKIEKRTHQSKADFIVNNWNEICDILL